ncbi:sugar kinase [Curvibacter sp. CHRR-16]|uniref:sugar kinase n=1 Tax=Curvibacter sp. CHRR-16 TaxID=2835872 RepID=UPI001BD947E2|nr:sugar kinase [Curvibacter sp. CHRR-16]MBT0569942.1 sugar kinase [Curvibacter sp. CHRR-16]
MNAQRSIDLIGLGECMVEFHAGATPLDKALVFERRYGGDVLNALVAASRCGASTAFISQVGDDAFAAGLLHAWQEEGVDTTEVSLSPGPNGIYFISVDADGERSFTYRRDGTPASRISPADLNPAAFRHARAVLLSGITQALSPSARSATLAAAQLAREHGVLVAYDPNYRAALWAPHGGLATAQAAFEELLSLCDWLLPSQGGDGPLVDLSDTEETDPTALAQRFVRPSLAVALKCGGHGCVLIQDKTPQTIAAATPSSVVDTSGAGDCWNGVFLARLLQGDLASTAATNANRIAAAKLAHRGAIPPRHFMENLI